jgi:predicted porin
MPTGPRARAVHLYPLFVILTVLAIPRMVLAEKVIAQSDDWQVFTDGRVAGFASWVHGDGAPIANPNLVVDGHSEDIQGGLWPVPTEPHGDSSPGTINMMRLRSGFLGNQLGFGVRGHITPWTTVTAYVQFWAYIESDDRNKSSPNPPDARQGYAKLEGPWGSFTAGRQRTLTSRGATDINVLYAHKWGVGFPNAIDKKGPTLGMVGFGVLGSGFAAGMIYGTPSLGGLQLNVGIFDPASVGGSGWNGTKWVRPETELTFEGKFGQTGKVVLFANGTIQKVYKAGQCNPAEQPCDETVEGFGYGGRFELGPFHLGIAGHYGKGLGLSYALENSYAASDSASHLRWSDGYYVQGQVVLNKFDLFAGWGISRIFLTDLDQTQPWNSVIKHQMGINGGIVYNVTPNLHVDVEYFRAEAAWFLGEKQVLNCAASGLTFNW